MIRYEIRGATPEDETDLLGLAGELDTVNLPHDAAHVRRLLDLSTRSFSGEIADSFQRRYVFVLSDLEAHRLAGTSMIIAQHGRREAPYIYFDVYPEERYSRTLDRYFHHTVMRLDFAYDGPTEIGGLVVSSDYRKAPERLGQLISYVRFLFIGGHRDRFRAEVVAELLPPLEPDGTSHLWEALGRRFTNLSYQEADRLSSENKDFIEALFPRGSIYATLLSADAQSVIGEVGAQTKGVERMLRRVGFRYLNRVDPFDGGPHFGAATEEITLVKQTKRVLVERENPAPGAPRGLVGIDFATPPFFRAVACHAELAGDALRVPEDVRAHLGLETGQSAVWLELP